MGQLAKWKELGQDDAVARACMSVLTVTPAIIMRVVKEQGGDKDCQDWVRQLLTKGAESYSISFEGGLCFHARLIVPDEGDLRRAVMTESHGSRFAVHPGGDKMYQDLRRKYWWAGMKRDISEFVSQCVTCQLVKVDHQWPTGLLQPLEILVWKWESI